MNFQSLSKLLNEKFKKKKRSRIESSRDKKEQILHLKILCNGDYEIASLLVIHYWL